MVQVANVSANAGPFKCPEKGFSLILMLGQTLGISNAVKNSLPYVILATFDLNTNSYVETV